jgi:hypothetical protein
VFFIDFETGESWKDALAELKAMVPIKELGFYKRKLE